MPTKARKRLPVPLATLTTTQSQASEAPPETAKPLLSANQLNQLTSRNTTHNKRPYNSHSTVVINKNGCRPPSPSAKIHIAATQKDCTGQQATENAEGKTRTTRSSTDALLDDARDINGTMLVRRSRVKRVQWEKVLEGNEEEGLAKGCRPEASRKGILLVSISYLASSGTDRSIIAQRCTGRRRKCVERETTAVTNCTEGEGRDSADSVR